MPKMLIIENCLVNYKDDRGGVAHAQGEFIEVSKETAKKIAIADRALYLSKNDDHDPTGRYTAPERMINAAKKMSKSQPPQQPPQQPPLIYLNDNSGSSYNQSGDQSS